MADPAASPGARTAVRRALVFAVVLVVLGVVTVALRVYPSGLHPQLLLFVYSIPANSAISLFSHEVALIDYGAHQPLLLTTLTATLGTIAAGWLDWQIFVPLLDSSAIARYRTNRVYRTCIDRFTRAPFVVLVITGFTPIPFFPFKFLAFSVRYPLARYLAALTVARAPRYLLLAWFGSAARVPEWLLLLAFALIMIPPLWQQLRGGGAIRWREDKR